MTLEHVYLLSQIIAAVAVVVSISYLARQVAQSEQVQRAFMQQGRADRVSSTALALAQPELARIWHKGLSPEPDFTRDEFVQWLLVCRAAFLSGEDSVLQHKAGMLDDAAFRSYEAGARAYSAFPAFRAAWQMLRTHYGPDFQQFVDGLLSRIPEAPSPDLYTDWQERLKMQLRPPAVPAADYPEPRSTAVFGRGFDRCRLTASELYRKTTG